MKKLHLLLLSSLLTLPAMAEQHIVKPKSVQKPEVQRVSEYERIEIQRHTLKTQLKKLDITLSKLKKLHRQPMPKELNIQEQQEWRQHSKWLKNKIKQLSQHRKSHQMMVSKSKLPKERIVAQKQQQDLLADMHNVSMEFSALQNAIQMEARQYNVVSNALKVRHDAAMATIRNMK